MRTFICFILCVSVLPEYMCTMFLPGAHGGQKDSIGTQGTEVTTAVSCHMGAGD